MPTQESKAHHVGEWASLRNTSPEIAEAIFEVARYDEKLAEQIWEEGNDEVLVRAFEYWRNIDADIGARIEKATRDKVGGTSEAPGMASAQAIAEQEPAE